MKLLFKGELLNLTVKKESTFDDKKKVLWSIRATDAEGYPYMSVTTRTEKFVLKDEVDGDYCVVKDYSENEGILECLIENKIVEKIRKISSGFVMLDVCKLLIKE